MSSARVAISLFLCMAASAVAVAQPAGGHLKPGLWEITNLNETVGTSNRRSTVSRVCFSAEDVRSVEKIIPPQREFGSKCESRDVKLQGETATWRVACAGKDSSLGGRAEVTFAGSSFSGSARLDARADGKTSKVDQKLSGTWISECK